MVSIKAPQGPYSIASKNTIHCNVSPRPHLPVTYQWRTTAAGVRISDTSAVSPNATVVIQPSATKYVFCYCIVKQTGTTIVSAARSLIVSAARSLTCRDDLDSRWRLLLAENELSCVSLLSSISIGN